MVNLVVRHGSSSLQSSAPVKLPPIITSPRAAIAVSNVTSPVATPSTYRSPVGGETNDTANTSKNGFGSARIGNGPRSRRELSSLNRAMLARGRKSSSPSFSQTTSQASQEGEEAPEEDRAHSSSDYEYDYDSGEEERQQPSMTAQSPPSEVATATELECDYDQSVTPLYEMLESSRWDDALERCQTHPIECHTWIIRRGDEHRHQQEGNIRWKLLPLHAAVIFQSPASLINALIEENPSAVTKRDDQGMLPIHLAFRHKLDENIVRRLMEQYPGGVLCKDSRDRLPIDHGKESRYTIHFVRLYSEMCIKATSELLQNTEGTRYVSDDDVCKSGLVVINHTNIDQINKITAKYEARIDALNDSHKALILALTQEHEKAQMEMKLKMDSMIHETEKVHNQEMDELRVVLAREVASGQKSDQLQCEVERLTQALADSQQECKVLRSLVRDQKAEYDSLLEDMVQLTKDQSIINKTFQQQQEDLSHARHERELILKKLLQREECQSTTCFMNELSQMIVSISSRTERLMSKYEGAIKTPGVQKGIQKGVLTNVEVPKTPPEVPKTPSAVRISTDVAMTPRFKPNSLTPLMDDERRLQLLNADDYESKLEAPSPDAGWNNGNHQDDDISAITENTNF